MKILVLNSGSSSQKTALFELGPESSSDPSPAIWEGKLEWDGNQETLTIRNSQGKKIQRRKKAIADQRHASVEAMLCDIWMGDAAVLASSEEVEVIGHRIVHGGPKLAQPVIINDVVKQSIRDVSQIAPLHNQAGLQGIEIAGKLFPGKPQVAVFDTGFHRTMPAYASVYPGPDTWVSRGIQRYGFHGINHEYCAHRAARMLGRELASLKIVNCHLGNGCSLAAVDGGKSVDTTMGFTPLEGLMMGTRAGSVDPGILIHLLRTDHLGADQLDDLLNRQSGLLGISGVSSDMRDVLAAAGKDNRAKLAFDIFVHRLQKEIAAMSASMGGVDVIIFTAGIGENSAEVRHATCEKLEFLGVHFDKEKNTSAKPDLDISPADSRVRVLVIGAQEDWSIAKQCVRLSSSRHGEGPQSDLS